VSHPKDRPSGQKAVSSRRLALGLMRDMRGILRSAIYVWGLPAWLLRIDRDPRSWDELRLIGIHLQDAAARLAVFSEQERDKLKGGRR
jgi:hypothetical protein